MCAFLWVLWASVKESESYAHAGSDGNAVIPGTLPDGHRYHPSCLLSNVPAILLVLILVTIPSSWQSLYLFKIPLNPPTP